MMRIGIRGTVYMNNPAASSGVSKGSLRPKGRGIRPAFIPLGFASGIIRPSNFSALRF